MRSVLFRIPLDGVVNLGPLGKIPVFGLGLILGLWTLIGLIYLGATVRRQGWKGISGVVLVIWGVVAVALFKAGELSFKSIPIYGYGSMLFVAFVASASLAAHRLRQLGADGEMAWDSAMWIFICGIFGARLFYVVEYRHRFFGPDPITGKGRTAWETIVALINLPDGGLVLYGGLIFAPLAFYVYSRYRKIRPLAFADVAITSVFLGVMFGRLGCLLHGCCYGAVSYSVPWAITFPPESVPFEALVGRGLIDKSASCSLPLHPSQLYDALSGFLLALFTWAYYPRRRWTGEVVALGWIAYPINRFLIEFLRSDKPGQFATRLTIAQWVSMGLFAGGVAFYAYLYWRKPGLLPLEIAPATRPQPKSGHPTKHSKSS